jgi:hypothetical protein
LEEEIMDLMSTAQLLGNFGEFVGAIAVVTTLGFLTFQIRQNTKATKAAMDHTIRTDFNRLHEVIMTNPEVVELLNRVGHSDHDHQARAFANWLLNRYVAVETAFDGGSLPAEDKPAWTADFARSLELWPGLIPLMHEQMAHYPEYSGRKGILDPLRDRPPE